MVKAQLASSNYWGFSGIRTGTRAVYCLHQPRQWGVTFTDDTNQESNRYAGGQGLTVWEAALLERRRRGGWAPGGQQVERGAVSVRVSQKRPREAILPLCLLLVRRHLKWCIQFGVSQYKKGIDILE